MKELKLLTEWADSVIEAAPAQHAPTRMGTPIKGKADRPLPRNIDIQYKAQRAHPELSPDQALAMYMSDELVDKEKMDFSQNKLINRVKGENEKLSRTVQELGRELHDFEQHSQQTDQEVARLKDLSAKLKPAGELQQQTIKASTDQVQRMLHDLETVKAKPGMDEKKARELEDKIAEVQKNGASTEYIKHLEGMLSSLANKPQVDASYFSSVTKRLQDIESHEAGLRKELEGKLSSKEARFKQYVRDTNRAIKQYTDKFDALNDKLEDMENRSDDLLINMTQATANLDRQTVDAQEKINQLASLLGQDNPDKIKPKSKISSIASKVSNRQDREDQDEVDVAKTASTALEPELPLNIPAQDSSNQSQYGLADIDKLPNKFNNRQPYNVKRGGQMNEQIDMIDPSDDEVEKVLIPALVRRYEHMFPNDLRKWSLQQLLVIIRKTVDGGLFLYDDPTEEQIDNYLQSCHNWLMRTRPAQQDWLSQQKPGSVQESVFAEFTSSINQLTGGY